MTIDFVLPGDASETRGALYGGALIKLAPRAETVRLVRGVRAIVRRVFADVGAPRRAPHSLGPVEMHARVTQARRVLMADATCRAMFLEVMASCGFDPGEHAVDAIRLRAVLSGGHRIVAAAPVYTAHRDTWYANPRAQINWWIPLHGVDERETFVFYPGAFEVPVANTSSQFDYEAWREQVGFQNPSPPAGAVYPRAVDHTPPFEPFGFSARMGEVVLFAGAHLHQTRAHDLGRTRFSIDIRTVHLDDHYAGLGPPVPDDGSRGSTLVDYRRGGESALGGAGPASFGCSPDFLGKGRPR